MDEIIIPKTSEQERQFELRFQSLFHEGKSLSFPCDAGGHVQLDSLSDRARANYLFARAVVGHEYATPVVQPSLQNWAH